MKIGILSMQRVLNYGSFLQAYALKETLKKLGHECCFIDIQPGRAIIGNTSQIDNESRIAFIIQRIDIYLLNRIKHYFFSKSRTSRFYNEFFPILGVSEKPNYDSAYDTVVIGSDEVFNCTQKAEWGFAKTLLGEGLNSNFVITYAASCGHTNLDKLDQLQIKEEVKNAMINLKTISVRDKNTKEFAEELTGKEIYEHIDPTLIYDFANLVPVSVPGKNYILIYAYDGRIKDKETIAMIKKFAKKEKKLIVCAGVYQSWCDRQILCTPFELLAYFKNADYVVTDTFHGTVFSIKYNRKFVTIIRDSNREKLYDLLERFKLTDRLMAAPGDLENILTARISYKNANEAIKEYTRSALEYFECQLGKSSVCGISNSISI